MADSYSTGKIKYINLFFLFSGRGRLFQQTEVRFFLFILRTRNFINL